MEASDVSLVMATNSLHMAGSTFLNACGRMMRIIVWLAERPSERAASVWPRSMDWMPERKTSDIYAPELKISATAMQVNLESLSAGSRSGNRK